MPSDLDRTPRAMNDLTPSKLSALMSAMFASSNTIPSIAMIASTSEIRSPASSNATSCSSEAALQSRVLES